MSRGLLRELGWVVALKLALLTLLYLLFFSPSHRNPIDAAVRIAGPAPAALMSPRPAAAPQQDQK